MQIRSTEASSTRPSSSRLSPCQSVASDGSSGTDVSQLAQTIERQLEDAEFYRVRTFSDAQPALRRSFERMGRYLGLVGLLSLLVGGVGVAQVARAWLSSRMDDIAIMRCLSS